MSELTQGWKSHPMKAANVNSKKEKEKYVDDMVNVDIAIEGCGLEDLNTMDVQDDSPLAHLVKRLHK